ncbi:MAG: MoaD/ThiS family protein [Candidatus Methylomirabilia bacterium]
MPTVAVHFVGVLAPGMPRDLVLSLEEGSTVRDALEAIATRVGGHVGARLVTESGGLEGSVQVAVDGEVVERDQLDTRLPATEGQAAVSVLLVRAIFGGAAGCRGDAREEL